MTTLGPWLIVEPPEPKDLSSVYLPWLYISKIQHDFYLAFLPTVQLAGSLMVLSGRLDITNNDLTRTDGGAFQFVSFSQLQILKGSEIHFENNTGT